MLEVPSGDVQQLGILIRTHEDFFFRAFLVGDGTTPPEGHRVSHSFIYQGLKPALSSGGASYTLKTGENFEIIQANAERCVRAPFTIDLSCTDGVVQINLQVPSVDQIYNALLERYLSGVDARNINDNSEEFKLNLIDLIIRCDNVGLTFLGLLLAGEVDLSEDATKKNFHKGTRLDNLASRFRILLNKLGQFGEKRLQLVDLESGKSGLVFRAMDEAQAVPIQAEVGSGVSTVVEEEEPVPEGEELILAKSLFEFFNPISRLRVGLQNALRAFPKSVVCDGELKNLQSESIRGPFRIVVDVIQNLPDRKVRANVRIVYDRSADLTILFADLFELSGITIEDGSILANERGKILIRDWILSLLQRRGGVRAGNFFRMIWLLAAKKGPMSVTDIASTLNATTSIVNTNFYFLRGELCNVQASPFRLDVDSVGWSLDFLDGRGESAVLEKTVDEVKERALAIVHSLRPENFGESEVTCATVVAYVVQKISEELKVTVADVVKRYIRDVVLALSRSRSGSSDSTSLRHYPEPLAGSEMSVWGSSATIATGSRW
ncbi:hypothetical protein KA119_00195 [Candidatus Gracilibacteria bacterium]|nr:hypothetical protein [Candidatus Gracilibacteria bacterium]